MNGLLNLRARFAGLKVGIAIEQSRGAVIHALMMYDFLHSTRSIPSAGPLSGSLSRQRRQG